MNKNNGKIWPIAIGVSIFLVFLLGVFTIIVAGKLPVAESDIYMENYQSVDADANRFIKARIDFDKHYNLEYIGEQLDCNGSTVKYKISDKSMKPVENAKIEVILTRPNTHDFDMKLSTPTEKEGVYVFASQKLPKEGRWNIMAKVSIGDKYRFYNLKADTRYKETFEY